MKRILALVAVVLAVTGCGGAESPAMLVETADPVRVNGKAVKALPTAPLALAAGDTLEVGPKGLARLVYPDGSRFLLLPHDGAESSMQVTERASSAGAVVVKLVQGALAFFVPPKRERKDRYEIRALNTVTTIEGTAGRVTTAQSGDTVALEHGTVTVAAGGKSTKVTALQKASFQLGGAELRVEPYDPTAPAEREYYEGKKLLTF